MQNGSFAQTGLHNDNQSSYYTAKRDARQAEIGHRIPAETDWRDIVGKSVVLKDLEHRPQGYVRADCDSVICRAKLDAPAQLAVLLLNGEIRQYAIDGPQEQQFSCDGAQLSGCFVHREETLLLVSDETMQEEFTRHRLRLHKKAETKPALRSGEQKENGQTEKQEEKKEDRKTELTLKDDRENVFPQRRWPPLPCWETACYRDGCWQERASHLKCE